MNRMFVLIAMLAALGVGLIYHSKAQAEVVQTHYTVLRTLPAKSKDAISSADAKTWATPINPKETLGNPSIAAYLEWDTADATAVVECGLYFKDASGDYTYIGPAGAKVTATAAASGNTNGAGHYPALAPVVFSNTLGAPYYDLRITSISTNTVTVRQWAFGAKSQY